MHVNPISHRESPPGHGRRLHTSGRLALKLTCCALGLGLSAACAEAPIEYDWVEEDGHRWAALESPSSEDPGFEQMDPESMGIDFVNRLSDEQIVQNRNLLNGSGVAVGDVTGDGRPDLYLARLDGPNRLYENLGGWSFRDITESAGVALPDQFSTGTTFADVDGDADLDLLVAANDVHPRLFLNDGGGVFSEAIGAFPTSEARGGTSFAVADIDGDGDLDVYLTNYKQRSVRDLWPYEQEFRFIVDRVDGEYRVTEKYRDHYRLEMRDSTLIWFEEGEPDHLFVNRGDGSFTNAGLDDGVLFDTDGIPIREPLRDWGLHARFRDFDSDGHPDLFVANDFESPDRIWRNRGDGTFQALPQLGTRKGSLSSMAVDFSDVDRDGLTDFFVVEMLSRDHARRRRQMGTMAPSPQPMGGIDNLPQYPGNTLFLNRGDGTWAEVGEQAGVRRSEWSWSSLFVDVDLDGYEDIIVGTGHHYDVQDSDANQLIRNRIAQGRLDMERVMLLYPPLDVPNAAFRNRGDGTFEDVTEAWGFPHPDVSHGMALGDLDGDGGLDLIMNRLGYGLAIYRGRAVRPRVMVRLAGTAPNTGAVGAVIRFDGGAVPQSKTVEVSGTYLSSSESLYTFAAGGTEEPLRIRVEWPDGSVSTIEDVRPDRIYEIRQSGALPDAGGPSVDPGVPPTTLVADDSPGVRHLEDAFRDFARHPLHPYRLSRLGPGVALFDHDGDGLDDLFMGNGADSPPRWLRNRGGALSPAPEAAFSAPLPSDQTGIVGWREDGVARLLVGLASREADGENPMEAVGLWELSGGQAVRKEGIPAWGASPGPLALGDVDGDGRLDLFVGGRLTPDRWPEPADSRIFRNLGGGAFEEYVPATSALSGIGLVTGAVFADLDSDGDPELVIAREWGTLAVFSLRDGELRDVSEEWGVGNASGWWNGLAVGDLNEDGMLDVVATNWGRNHLYASTSSPERPVRIRYADLDGEGDIQTIETYFGGPDGAEVPRRSFSVLWSEFPFIQDRVRTYDEFAEATLDEIFGPTLRETAIVEAAAFDHVVLWNRGGRFEVEPLPTQAQNSPAFHVSIRDMTGDGHPDVVLTQNFFSYQLETPRNDAGLGLLLAGDGRGGLRPVPAAESGIRIWGEQRGGAVGDLDGDGRLDMVAAQNGADLRVLRNRQAPPGLRVRLQGSPANPAGIGAQLRVETRGSMGPIREIQAGSGYWSMDSTLPVFPVTELESQLHVRWPRGEERIYTVPPGVREITVSVDGELTVVREDE